MAWGIIRTLGAPLALLCAGLAAPSAHAAEKARITGLTDVAFGTIVSFGDQSISQNVCAFTSKKDVRYSVLATGSGSGGNFALTSGSFELPYEVLWADSSGQTGGVAITAGTPASWFLTDASHQVCQSGPAASASLTIRLRSAELGSARAGAYSGSLHITIVPE